MKPWKLIIIISLIILIILLLYVLLIDPSLIFEHRLDALKVNNLQTNETIEKAYDKMRSEESFENMPVSNMETSLFEGSLKDASFNTLPKIISKGTLLWSGENEIYPDSIMGDYLNIKRKIVETKETNPPYKMKTSAWLDISDVSIKLFVKNAKYFDHVHPFLYDITGKLTNQAKVYVKRNSSAVYKMIKDIRKENPNIMIIPTIFRWETEGRLEIKEVIGIGSDGEKIMKEHIKNLIDLTDKYDFDGIDIDYEGMHRYKEEYFTNFIKELRKEIDNYNKEHKKHIVLSLSLHPKTWISEVTRDACISQMGFQGDYFRAEVDEAKERFASYSDDTSFNTTKPMSVKKWKTLTSDERTSFCKLYEYTEQWRGPQTHDFYEINKYADFIKIMAYEKFPMYGVPGPGPQAPLDWVREITRYTYDHIPKEKVYIGLPTYGYQRPVGGNTKGATTSVFWDTFKSLSNNFEYPTKIYRPDDPNWKYYNILKQYNPQYIHAVNGSPIWYYEPAIWYEKNGSYRVAFSVNGDAFKRKVNEVMRYPVAGFSMWQFIWRNDINIIEEIKKVVGEKDNITPKSLYNIYFGQ